MEHFTFGRNNGLRVSGAGRLVQACFGSPLGATGADQADIPKIFGRFADAGGTFIEHGRPAISSVRPRRIWIAFSTAGRDSFTHRNEVRESVVPKAMACCRPATADAPMVRSVEGSPAPARHRLHRPAVGALSPDLVTPLDEIVRGLDDLAARRKDSLRRVVELPGRGMSARAATLAELRGLIPVSGGSAGVQPRRTQR